MKSTNYLQMMEEAKTSAEAQDILMKVDEIISKVLFDFDLVKVSC